VAGDEVRIGDAGTDDTATDDGDLYVEDDFEVDGLPAGTASAVCINADGSLTIGSVTDCQSSDGRLKQNIVTLENALDRILKLRGVNFEFRPEMKQHYTPGLQLGLIAQEVRAIVPEVVSEMSDGYLSVSYGNMAGLFVESFRELNLKLEGLATTTPEIQEGFFTSRFFSSLLTHIRTWLANAQNGITDFFALRGIFEELCAEDANGQTCLTRSQVDAMLSASAAAGAPTEEDGRGAPASSPASGDEPRVGTTTTPAIEASSTPAVLSPLSPANDNASNEVEDENGDAHEHESNSNPEPDEPATPHDAASDPIIEGGDTATSPTSSIPAGTPANVHPWSWGQQAPSELQR
jgi:Chaperone of endosialidase